MGARVIACASSDDKIAFAKKHGADEGVNYAREDLREALKRLGGEHGIDVVYDPIGDKYAEPALRSLAWERPASGRRFCRRRHPETAAQFGAAEKLRRARRVLGSWTTREPEAQRANGADLVRWCAEGKLSAHVHARYPLADVARALKDIAERKVMGKAVLVP